MNPTPINYGDLALWSVVSFLYFGVMGAGFRPNSAGDVIFQAPRPGSTYLKTALAVAPLFLLHFAPDTRLSPFWDALCLMAMAVVAGPLAFPTLGVELKKYTFEEKVGRWLGSRLDLAIKKWTIAALLGFGLSFIHSFSILDYVPIPHYFIAKDVAWMWPFATSFLVLAFISLLLRCILFLAVSKVLAFLVVPIGFMLFGYVAELGGALHHRGVSFSVKLFVLVVADLLTFMFSTYQSRE